MSEIVHVAFCTNERYFPGLFCAIGSILLTFRANRKIVFYVIDAGVTPLSKSALESLITREGRHELVWLDAPTQLFEKISSPNYHKAALYRLALPELLKNVQRLIYLDVDVIVLECLGRLWEEALGSNQSVCAVDDRETFSVADDSLEFARLMDAEDRFGYFNSGVMVLNLESMRQSEFTKKACDCLNNFGEMIRFPDQSVLNALCSGAWDRLDTRWNTPAWIFDNSKGVFLRGICHYTNHIPWLNRKFAPSQKLFEFTATQLGLEFVDIRRGLFFSCLIAVLRWSRAPFRVLLQFGRLLCYSSTGQHLKSRVSYKLGLFWLREFWYSPIRIVKYLIRSHQLRRLLRSWDFFG